MNEDERRKKKYTYTQETGDFAQFLCTGPETRLLGVFLIRPIVY